MAAPDETGWLAIARRRMVETQLAARGIRDARVLAAMQRVPRHVFVMEPYQEEAYGDHPLPIGEGQTISQPYIVASMLEALELTPSDRVLDVGTGSGYVTALMAELAAEVFSIERHDILAEQARERLSALGYTNVKVVAGDGSLGLPAHAPFDAIMVSAAARSQPTLLISQLREGGRMIVPVGDEDSQQLQFIRMQNGQPIIFPREAVRFVPLVEDNWGH